MKQLEVVASLKLPDCYIAAGFVRNLVWDHMHRFDNTPLSDVDVIYFDSTQSFNPESIQKQLLTMLPRVNWQVKNQASMHIRNGDEPYTSSTDAMAYWPEKETAIGVRLNEIGSIEVAAPFGVQSLFAGHITHNPKRPVAVFERRAKTKNWLGIWPQLKMVY